MGKNNLNDHITQNLKESICSVLRKSLKEEKDAAIDKSIKQRDVGTVTTPEEVTQRAYFNKRRSEGDISPEEQAQYDAAFKDQQAAFGQMSQEAQKKAALMWGNPTDPNYRTAQFNLAKGTFNNPLMRGLSHGERKVTVAKDRPDSTTVPHEMTHVQQFSNTTGGKQTSAALEADTANPEYRERDIEAGAQSKAELLALRNKKSPQDALKPLSPSEVNTALDRTKGPDNQYVGFENEPETIKAELKKYMERMIVRNPSRQPEGTAAA